MLWIAYQLAAVLAYSLTNVIDSLLVHRFTKDPLPILWIRNFLVLCVLLCIIPVLQVMFIPFAIPMFLCGASVGIGSVFLCYSLKGVDVSLLNISWLLLSILLLAAGLLFFQETLSTLEAIGVLVIFVSVLLLVQYHRTMGGTAQSIVFVLFSSLFFAPYYIGLKYGLERDNTLMQLWWWGQLGQALPIVLFPVGYSGFARRLDSYFTQAPVSFYLLSALKVFIIFAATRLEIKAYDTGPLSLVAVVGNLQAFMVILLAFGTTRILPAFAPREALDRQSIVRKTAAFCLALMGLVLLAVGGQTP